ncbi:dispatched homolog 1 [Seminavis robusta]|uniref:Dispatched homolog 1 n=1 Tax=Seminavis robusta TaxID=568900 RepID=A0A9N8E9D3_9STRA|nr:dispatched homolog 1 [Seminavis robusta]|eukprot:Sro652_g181860.1 dispatched homolog 1 (1039) ;mRNA; f:38391-41763
MSTKNNENTAEEPPQVYNFWQRQAMRMARWRKTHFWVAFAISLGLSYVGFAHGDFSVTTEGGGWSSRGTLIADRQTQLMMVTEHEDVLFWGGDAAWEELINVVQPGWEETEDSDGRRLTESETININSIVTSTHNYRQAFPMISTDNALMDFLARRLQEDTSGVLDGCDTAWYTDGRLTNDTRLWPVWKVTTPTNSALHPEILRELCEAEEETQRLLEEKGLCFGCEESASRKCLPPHGLPLYARMIVPDGLSLDCQELANAWMPYQAETEADWKVCVEYIEANPSGSEADYAQYCNQYFYTSLLDEFFDSTGYVEYTSSIFATDDEMVDELYKLVDSFSKGGERIEGAYDTQYEDFVGLLADGAVGMDMLLATGSALVTAVAIMVHTKSLFLTIVGLVQISFSFPLAYFVYHFICGFTFFPFLNFIGVFVVFAMGADHVFVAVDKWKNARLAMPGATTEEIAARALPDAASAMFLTTSTTACAFFGTAICPVAPVRLFSIFCGLLITFDYVLDVFLMFPCLCIYDGYRDSSNCCISCCCCRRTAADNDDLEIQDSSSEGEDETPLRTSLIRRILLGYYNLLHKIRWPLLAASAIAFIVCCIFASSLGLPNSSDVRVLKPSVEFEKRWAWGGKLLYEALEKKAGSEAFVIWGVQAADTGDHSNPESWSTLVLDDTFDPSTQAAQSYLKDYCPRFLAKEFASIPDDYECPINRFDTWLQTQSAAASSDSLYETYCAGASALPMDSNAFHACFTAWAQLEQETSVLSRNGVVEVMYFSFNSRVRYDSPNEALDSEWNMIEDWMNSDRNDNAPEEASNAFFSSHDFWWYDTNSNMFRTAYGSAAIALAAAGAIILISSRSLVMTLFSVLSIGYVLASVTAMMVAVGWDLGFLESICFAILIGVSVDFVIHFSHAYVALPGDVSRERRTKHALIDMGPSILAAAFTTLAGAMVMLFCVITFFTKFAMVLFFTIIQATIGSFVVFLTLTDCIGPREPTSTADRLIATCVGTSKTPSSPDTSVGKPSEADDIEITETARSATVY